MLSRTSITGSMLAALILTGVAGTASAEDAKGDVVVAADLTKVVLFPLEGVNVQPHLVRATTYSLATELGARSIEVVDMGRVEAALAEDSPAPQAPVVLAPQPVPVQPPAAVQPPTQPIGPPPYPPQPRSAQPAYVAPAPHYVQQPVYVVRQPPLAQRPAPRRRVLADEERRELLEQFGADGYATGSLVGLGSQMSLTVNLYDADGQQLASERMPAKSADDISIVLPRLVLALLTDQTVAETQTLDNATRAETTVLPQRFKVEKNFGPLIGVLITTDSDAMPTMPLLGVSARFEFDRTLAEVAGGFAIHGELERDSGSSSSDSDSPLHLFVNISAAYYLSRSSVSPYLGGGAGFFLGERVGQDADDDGTAAGVELFPLLGLELMRSTRIRLHLDLRYSFNVDAASGDWGHGPGVLAGVNF